MKKFFLIALLTLSQILAAPSIVLANQPEREKKVLTKTDKVIGIGASVVGVGTMVLGTILMGKGEDKKNIQVYGVGFFAMILGLGTFCYGGAKMDTSGVLERASLYQVDSQTGQLVATGNANLGKLLRDTEMAAYNGVNGDLDSGSVFQDVASNLNMSVERFSQLILSGKSVADAKLDHKQFGPGTTSITKEELLNSAGSLSDKEFNVVRNYLGLRNIAVL